MKTITDEQWMYRNFLRHLAALDTAPNRPKAGTKAKKKIVKPKHIFIR